MTGREPLANVQPPITPQRRFIQFLDRPGGRWMLAFLSTRYARRKTRQDVEVFYSGAWFRRSGADCLASGPTFFWNKNQITNWKPGMEDVLEQVRGWWFHRYQPREGDIIVDVGAGLGDEVLLFSRAVGAGGRLLAIEAHPATFGLLQKTCSYSRLANTTCVHCAVADKAGTVFIDTRAFYAENTISLTKPDERAHPVQAASLDESCAQYKIDHINFLKMNIEGAERLAIKGMRRMIQKTDKVCIACHDFLAEQNDFYRTREIVMDFLLENGFDVEYREGHPEPWTRDHVHAARRK